MANKRSNKPTIYEVARLAGVSTGTVSNVLSGAVPVSEERRTRVLEAVAMVGFTPNVLAQWLPSKTTGLIGICVPRARLALFSDLTEQFGQLARADHYETLQVLSPTSPEEELQQIQSLMKYRLGGLVLLPSVRPEATLTFLKNSALPTVIIDRPVPDSFGFDQVSIDNVRVMTDLLERLYQYGHRRVLFMFRDRMNIVTQQRLRGAKLARERFDGLVVDSVPSGDDAQEFQEAFVRAREAFKPTVVITTTSYMAEWAIRSFRVLGVRVPRDCSMVTLDEPAWADILEPPLSVLRTPIVELARQALTYLIARMKGEMNPPKQTVLAAEMIMRESVRDLMRDEAS
ncbi:MAG TPA: LacI family DNA-binding transcriptional regulator [Devosiaceae bacterium]|jgi:LacI family transcriptional regulator